MLPSSIIAPADPRTRSAPSGSTMVLRSSGGSIPVAEAHPLGRGPLAERAMRLLGIGAPGQAWSSWAQPALAQAFGSGAEGQAWLAARILPTPNGYIRGGM